MRRIPFYAPAIALTFAASALYAQVDSATLAGTVVDATGAAVPNASVMVKNTATGFQRDTKANSSGVYNIPGLPIGTYAVTVSFTGFGSFKTDVTLNVGANATIDAKLGAAADQTVVVESADEATQVNLTNQETSTIITSKEIIDLPSLTRNPYDFVVLSGAAASDPNGSTARGVGFSLNGQRSSGTEVLLDGVENADSYDATVGQTIPLDSVQEYRVIVNGFDAQYGRASGGIVNLATRSGTNKIHGSAYEFNRVSALASNTYAEDANNFQNRAAGLANNPSDHFTQNQFGYSIGGPILHDKLFAFNNYEWNRVRSSGQATFLVPTAAFLATTSAATQAYFAKYGTIAPTTKLGATVAVPYATFTNPLQLATVTAPINAGAGDPVNQIFGDTRVDFTLNNKISMFARVATFKSSNFPGFVSLSPYNGFNTTQTNSNQSYLYSLNYVITPNLLSSSKLSYSRINISEPLGTAGIVPGLYLNQPNVASTFGGTTIALPGYLPGAPGGAIPFGGPQNTYQFIEQLSYTKGKHTVTGGGQFLQIRDNRTFGAYENAVEQVARNTTYLDASGKSITGSNDGYAINQLAAGDVYSFEVALNPQGKLPCSYNAAGSIVQTSACQISAPVSSPSFVRENTFNDGNLYLEDQFKLTRTLTVTAGVRWEYYGVQHNTKTSLESNFLTGAGANAAIQIANGQVVTTPNNPNGGLTKRNLNNFAPRIGFALDLFGDGKTAIRGGYGISYERNFGNVTYNTIQNPPAYAGVTLTAAKTLGATITAPDGSAYHVSTSNFGPFGVASGVVPIAPPSLRALDPHMPTALTHQYSLTVEHELSRNDLLSLTYSGARGIHLYSIANINGEGYGTFAGYTAGSYGVDRINHQYGAINVREANGDSYYNALNASFKVSNLSHYGVTAVVNYTYAHSMDNLSSTFSESGNNFNLGYLNPFAPGLDRGNSDNDTRHRVTIGGVYQPTFLEFKSNRLLHTIAGGLEFAPIATIRTGTPFNIYDCTNGLNACPRIIGTAAQKFHGTIAGTANDGVNSFNYLAIDPAAANPFTNSQGDSDFPDTLGGYQNQGLDRNQWYGPKNISFDMGAYKNFAFGSEDRYKVQIRGEFFNILNLHNYYPVVGSADIAEVANVNVLKGTPGGSSPSSSDERRNVQLAVRLEF